MCDFHGEDVISKSDGIYMTRVRIIEIINRNK